MMRMVWVGIAMAASMVLRTHQTCSISVVQLQYSVRMLHCKMCFSEIELQSHMGFKCAQIAPVVEWM